MILSFTLCWPHLTEFRGFSQHSVWGHSWKYSVGHVMLGIKPESPAYSQPWLMILSFLVAEWYSTRNIYIYVYIILYIFIAPQPVLISWFHISPLTDNNVYVNIEYKCRHWHTHLNSSSHILWISLMLLSQWNSHFPFLSYCFFVHQEPHRLGCRVPELTHLVMTLMDHKQQLGSLPGMRGWCWDWNTSLTSTVQSLCCLAIPGTESHPIS